MLWTLLSAITSVAFFTSAILAAKQTKAGIVGYILAVIIGSSLAICNAWGLNKVVDILADLPNSYSETQEDWIGRVICILVLLWGVIGAVLTGLATSAVMRLIA